MYVFKHMISEYLSISSTDEAVVTAKRLVFIALFTVHLVFIESLIDTKENFSKKKILL